MLNVRRVGLMKLLSAALLGATLTACDGLPLGKPDTEPSVEALENTAIPPTAEAPKPEKLFWNWSTPSGPVWSFGESQPEVYWPASGGMGLKTGADPAQVDVFVRSPKFEVDGSVYTKIVVDLECVAPAEQNDLTIYYINQAHSESPEFRAVPLNAKPLVAGERRKLVYDMTNLARGGTDWTEHKISRIRFDLPQGMGSDYILHSVQICSPDDQTCE